jgi:hypothetical protein
VVQNDLPCPPINLIPKNQIKEKEEESAPEKIKDDGINIIEELDNFLKETFKLIDLQNELKEFKASLKILRENILGRKIRISLIGNISVGKSSVLNCIIGHNILPTKDSECTYKVSSPPITHGSLYNLAIGRRCIDNNSSTGSYTYMTIYYYNVTLPYAIKICNLLIIFFLSPFTRCLI